MDDISLLKEKFGEIGTVLAGDPRNEGYFFHITKLPEMSISLFQTSALENSQSIVICGMNVHITIPES